MSRVRYYKSFSDDFEETQNQDFELPRDYKWIRKDFFSKALSALIYCVALAFSSIYCKLFLHIKIKGRKKLKNANGGFFIYCNHTQPLGDVFIPALCAFPRRIYTVVSTANYGIPIIGKILPFLGALPIGNSLSGMKQFNCAVKQRIEEGHPVAIFPEAHVWKYYTQIRPFSETAFKFPTVNNCAAFSATAVYKASRLFKRPVAEIYIDGPFYGEGDTARQKSADLHLKIRNAMCGRSRESNFEYIKYIRSDTEVNK